MKLETEMYVRTRWGIAKITEISEEIVYIDTCFKPIDETKIFKEDIIKASYNIIDLIEVEDYVNGYKVTNFDETYFNGTDRLKEPKKIRIVIDNGKYEFENRIKNDDIKSIVIKEQFKEIEYKVEENDV